MGSEDVFHDEFGFAGMHIEYPDTTRGRVGEEDAEVKTENMRRNVEGRKSISRK